MILLIWKKRPAITKFYDLFCRRNAKINPKTDTFRLKHSKIFKPIKRNTSIFFVIIIKQQFIFKAIA